MYIDVPVFTVEFLHQGNKRKLQRPPTVASNRLPYDI